jgi:hypothetical protein
MDTSMVLKPGTKEYDTLRRASALLTAKSPNGYTYTITECYMDYGAGIYWTTIHCDNHNGWGGFQALSPREWDDLILYDKDLDEFVKEHFADKWCADTKK